MPPVLQHQRPLPDSPPAPEGGQPAQQAVVFPPRVDRVLAGKDIVPLIEAAEQIHAEYERRTGRKMVPDQYVDQSRLEQFDDKKQRHVISLLDFHGDPGALKLLKDALPGLDGKRASETLFILEGFGKPGFESRPQSPNVILATAAKRSGAEAVNAIRNISDAEVIFEMAALAKKDGHARPEELVVGALIHTMSPQSNFDNRELIPLGVDKLLKGWNSDGKHVTAEELYRAAEKTYEPTEQVRDQIGSLVDAEKLALEQSSRTRYLSDWATAEAILLKGSALEPPLSRQQMLGAFVHMLAPFREEGFSDYSRAMDKFKTLWGEKITWDQIHDGFVRLSALAQSDRKAFDKTLEQVGLYMHEAQDNRTAAAVAAELKAHPNAKIVVVVAGFHHRAGVRKGFDQP